MEESAFVEERRIIDNILLTQEIVKDYGKDKRKTRCAFKIEIMKSFELVNWNFVHNIMQVMGFPTFYIHWIKVCFVYTNVLC